MKRTLTQQIIDQASIYLQSGAFEKHIMEAMGLKKDAWYNWKRIGRELSERIEDGELAVADITDRDDKLCLEFYETLKKGRAKAMIRCLTLIQTAAQQNWQAAAWYLERVDPEHFARKDRLDVLMKAGIQSIRVDLEMTPEELKHYHENVEAFFPGLIEDKTGERGEG